MSCLLKIFLKKYVLLIYVAQEFAQFVLVYSCRQRREFWMGKEQQPIGFTWRNLKNYIQKLMWNRMFYM